MVSACVFELATQRSLAHAGARPGSGRCWRSQGAVLSSSMHRCEPRARPGRDAARSGDHARRAPSAAARRARQARPGAARRARQERTPTSRWRACRSCAWTRCSTAPAERSPGRARAARQCTVALEHELPGRVLRLRVDRDHVLRPEPALEDQLGDRVLDALLDRALQRPRAEHRIEARPWPARPAPRGETSSFMSIFSSRVSSTFSWICAIASMCLCVERVEHHRLVDAVQELGPEMVLHLDPHRVADQLAAAARPSA